MVYFWISAAVGYVWFGHFYLRKSTSFDGDPGYVRAFYVAAWPLTIGFGLIVFAVILFAYSLQYHIIPWFIRRIHRK